MNMNQHPHPDDERLSALAAADDDARTDASLRAHVNACDRCRGVMGELTSLRTHLAALPDLAPPRPIRFVLPPRAVAPVGFAQLVRRLFAPALAAGTTLAIIGAVGFSTSSMGLGGAAGAPPSAEAGGAGAEFDALASTAAESAAAASEATTDDAGAGAGTVAAASDGQERSAALTEAPTALPYDSAEGVEAGGPSGPPWLPMLMGGVVLAGIALVLRFAVVPRAG